MDIGVDIAALSRFRDRDEKFAKYFLTPEELAVYGMVETKEGRARFLATRWACKEALFKATQEADFAKYAILNDSRGKPYVAGHPEFKVSVSHDGDYVVAFVINTK